MSSDNKDLVRELERRKKPVSTSQDIRKDVERIVAKHTRKRKTPEAQKDVEGEVRGATALSRAGIKGREKASAREVVNRLRRKPKEEVKKESNLHKFCPSTSEFPGFERFCEEEAGPISPPDDMDLGKEAGEPTSTPQIERSTLKTVYNRFMPIILRHVKTPDDAKQVMAMIHDDISKATTEPVAHQFDIKRGSELGKMAGFKPPMDMGQGLGPTPE